MVFTPEQTQRYNRHLLLKDFGPEGQKKIMAAKVLVIGTGGLGSPVLLYLSAAGVGTLGIADGDVVDRTNLQRQVIHFTDDINRSKVVSATEKINRLNPEVTIIAHAEMVTSANIMQIIKDYDIIVDATDNFGSKFLINNACVLFKKPFVHASVIQFLGQIMTIIPGKTACYRCFFPEPPPGKVPGSREVGVFGATAGTLGTLQATEVIKFIAGSGDLLTNRLLVVETLEMKFREILIHKQDDCPACGLAPKISAPV